MTRRMPLSTWLYRATLVGVGLLLAQELLRLSALPALLGSEIATGYVVVAVASQADGALLLAVLLAALLLRVRAAVWIAGLGAVERGATLASAILVAQAGLGPTLGIFALLVAAGLGLAALFRYLIRRQELGPT